MVNPLPAQAQAAPILIGQDARGHLTSIANIRALASVGVMLFHFVAIDDFLEAAPWLHDTAWYGQFGVQLFFIISGFVIPYSLFKAQYQLASYGRFILKRLIRLDPPYFVSIALLIIIYSVLHNVTKYPFEINLRQIGLHFGYLNAFFQEEWLSDVYWSLSVEFQYYLLLGLLYPLLVGKTWERRLTLLGLLGVSFLAQSLPRDFFFPHTPTFVFGIAAFLVYTHKISRTEFYLYALAASACTLATTTPVILVTSFVALGLLFFFSYQHKVLTFFGDISYSLYLVHNLFGSIIISTIKRRTNTLWVELGAVALAIAVAVAAAYLLYRFVEKPSQRWSSAIKLKRG